MIGCVVVACVSVSIVAMPFVVFPVVLDLKPSHYLDFGVSVSQKGMKDYEATLFLVIKNKGFFPIRFKQVDMRMLVSNKVESGWTARET